MKFLLKLFCLLSLFISFSFSEDLIIYNDVNLKGYGLKPYDVKFLKGNSLIGVRYINRGSLNEYRVYRFRFDHNYYSGSKYSPGFYIDSGGIIYYFGGDVVSNHLYVEMNTWDYTVYRISNDPNQPFLTYSSFLIFHTDGVVATCGVNQEFDTETNKCVDPCPAGHFWNVETNSCIFDCSDEENHKFFTNDYKCIDCSSASTKVEIAKCYCAGLGFSFDRPSFVFASNSENPNFVTTFCDNKTEISFKFDKDKIQDKDNNSTNSSDKDKENSKPDKDKDNPNPDKKDNNENSNNSSGESGNPSNNNSGGSAGNGSSGGGGTGVETKPNPNYNGNGKQDGKGEEGKGDDAVAQKLDYGDLEKDSDKFNSDFKGALDSVISQAQDFKNSLNDTISKIKEGGLLKFNQSAIPSTCPLTYNVDFSYFRKDITFDICKVIAPASQTLYYFFYVVFFVLFLIITIKLFLFTF
ncbi:hypothetical protein [Campylobacter concisus]|uniref:hypothetical protein n=1 Tax=Campylobacter concisus TaxID=199 RepID=UPI0011E8431F|nr:hypothetical protein [Campylobacter concisus]